MPGSAGDRNDRPRHRLLGPEQVPRPPAGRRGGRGRRLVAPARPARRHPRPQRHAGHHLLALGPEPRRRRGAGHLPHRHRDARRAEGPGRPRVLRLRLLVRLRHLRGRHRHLLGPHADAGVPLGRPRPPAAGREDRARARRHRARLGLPVRARGQVGPAQPRGPALVPGLDPAVLPQVGAGRRRGGVARRLRPAVPGQRRSEPAPELRPLDPARGRGGARREHRGGRPADRVRRHRVHGPRPRLRAVDRRLREHRRLGERERHADPRAGHRPGVARAGPAARRVGSRRHRRGGVGHHRHAPGRERARRHRPRQEAHQGDRARPAARRDASSRSTTAPS